MERLKFEYDSANGIRIQSWLLEGEYAVKPTGENQCKLIYIVRGKLGATIDGQYVECNANETLVLPEKGYYQAAKPKKGKKGSNAVLAEQGGTEIIEIDFFPAIMPLFVTPNVIQLGVKTVGKYRISATATKTQNVYRYFKRILSLAQRQKLYKDAFIVAEIIQLVASVNVAIGETGRSSTSVERIKKSKKNIFEVCVKYINDNIAKPLTLGEIAKELYFSKSYLQHIFKQKTGVSISAYVNAQKMNVARAMLLNGGAPSVVAKQLGYEYYTTFSVKFKRYHGVSPKDVVQEQAEKKEERK